MTAIARSPVSLEFQLDSLARALLAATLAAIVVAHVGGNGIVVSVANLATVALVMAYIVVSLLGVLVLALEPSDCLGRGAAVSSIVQGNARLRSRSIPPTVPVAIPCRA